MGRSVLDIAEAMARRGRIEVQRLERAVAAAKAGEEGHRDPLWHLFANAGGARELADRLSGALRERWPADPVAAIAFSLEAHTPDSDRDLVSLVDAGRLEEAMARVAALW